MLYATIVNERVEKTVHAVKMLFYTYNCRRGVLKNCYAKKSISLIRGVSKSVFRVHGCIKAVC